MKAVAILLTLGAWGMRLQTRLEVLIMYATCLGTYKLIMVFVCKIGIGRIHVKGDLSLKSY